MEKIEHIRNEIGDKTHPHGQRIRLPTLCLVLNPLPPSLPSSLPLRKYRPGTGLVGVSGLVGVGAGLVGVSRCALVVWAELPGRPSRGGWANKLVMRGGPVARQTTQAPPRFPIPGSITRPAIYAEDTFFSTTGIATTTTRDGGGDIGGGGSRISEQ